MIDLPEPEVIEIHDLGRIIRRIRCLVPGCGHMRGIRKGETKLPEEWICGDHWKLVPRRWRTIRSRLHRRYQRTMARGAIEGENITFHNRDDWRDYTRLIKALGWMWKKMVSKAIESSMGI